MIVIEEWSWINGTRVHEAREYWDEAGWRMQLMLNTLAGTHVGYKLYDCSMREFTAMSDLQRSQSIFKQKFDKAAYRGESK